VALGAGRYLGKSGIAAARDGATRDASGGAPPVETSLDVRRISRCWKRRAVNSSKRVTAARSPLNEPVAEIIQEAQEKGSYMAFILMPLPLRHVQTFYQTAAWAQYERHVRNLLKEKNVTYIDASRWISDPGKFGDALHLSDEGAQEFSRRLRALCSDPSEAGPCQAR